MDKKNTDSVASLTNNKAIMCWYICVWNKINVKVKKKEIENHYILGVCFSASVCLCVCICVSDKFLWQPTTKQTKQTHTQTVTKKNNQEKNLMTWIYFFFLVLHNEWIQIGWLAGWLVGLLDSNLQLLLFRMCLCVYLFSLSKIHYLIISGKKKKFFFLTFSLFILYSALFILIRFGFELLVDFFFFFWGFYSPKQN